MGLIGRVFYIVPTLARDMGVYNSNKGQPFSTGYQQKTHIRIWVSFSARRSEEPFFKEGVILATGRTDSG